MEPLNLNRTRIISLSAYSAMFALGMAVTTWHELSMAQARASLEIIVAIIFNAQAVAVAAAGFAAIVETGGYIVLFAAHIIQKERDAAREKALEEGIGKGRGEAYEDAARQNDAYYRRMRVALEAGEPFDEPPPMFGRNGQ